MSALRTICHAQRFLLKLLPCVLLAGATSLTASVSQGVHSGKAIPERPVSFEQLPEGLAPVLARSMAANAPADYRFVKKDKRCTTTNRNHDFRIAFSSEGPQISGKEWNWDMTLKAWGRSRLTPVSAAHPIVSGSRLEYRRGPLVEWYLNSEMGLEQGFTLNEPPRAQAGAQGKIVLELEMSGNLQAHLKNATTVSLTDPQGRRGVIEYGGLYVSDASGKTLTASFDLSDARHLRILVDDREARYPITIDPWVQKAKLTGSDTNGKDSLGYSVAIDGDTVVVGAPQDGDNGTTSGAAFVFVKPGTGWANGTEAAKLTASDGAASDYFGCSVAVSGDTVVVGANVAKVGSNTKQGAAYVFKRPDTGWSGAQTETAKLTASDGAASDYFGTSVAVKGSTVAVGSTGRGILYVYYRSGDTWPQAAILGPNYGANGRTVVVADDESWVAGGASNATYTASTCGAVYVYNKPGANWSNMATYSAALLDNDANQHNQSQLGISLATSGDLVVAGAGETASAAPGAACVFTKPGGGWSGTVRPTARLTGSDITSSSYFAFGVAVSGSGDMIAVGTWFKNRIYVFKKPGTGWATTSTEDGILTNSDIATNSNLYLGNHLAMSADTLVASAMSWGGEQGAAYIYTKPGTGWATGTENAILTASDGSAGDNFGYFVDTDGDTAVVGAYNQNLRKGAVYVYSRPSSGWADATQTAKLTASDGESLDNLGWPVAIRGDVILAGAQYAKVGGVKTGKVYVFVKPSSGWANATESAQLVASDGAADGYFGCALATDGNTVFAALQGATVGSNANQGAVYVFTKPGGGWSGTLNESAKLTVSDGTANDYFATALAINNDVLVATTSCGPSDSYKGRAFIYVKPGGGWVNATQSAELISSDAADWGYFGFSASISGDTVVVGASGLGPGEAYVFLKPGGGWSGSISETAILKPSSGETYDNFGGAVAVSANTIAVGSSGYPYNSGSGIYGPGAVYLFSKPGSGWTSTTASPSFTGSANGDMYGNSVALYGGTLLVGAPSEFSSQGAAYLISGPIVSGNAGTAGASISVDGGTWTTTANSSGAYAFAAPDGWSGTITPSLAGYTFSPVSRSYTNLTADSASQDYTATPDPTVISLVSFTAQAGSKYVKLAWTTGSEVDTAGFYIWKASSKDGDYQRLNSSIIPAAGLAPSGASYSCMDASIGSGETWYYMLEDVDTTGHSTFHGPVSASAGTSAILSFKAIPTDIFKGGTSTLSWITSGNPTLYLNETALSGWSLGVSPNLTTSYTLRDDLGDAILVTVTVKPFALIDMAGLAKAWGSASGEAAYDPCYDLNGDGLVDDTDVGLCFTEL